MVDLEQMIRESLTYNPDTGDLIWRKDRPRNHFKNDHAYNTWFSQKSGKKVDGKGITITFQYQEISKSKVAWFLHYGEWPPSCINYVDGDYKNLKIINMVSNPPVNKKPAARKINSIGSSEQKVNKNHVIAAISYNPHTGDLIWKNRPRNHFKTDPVFKRWNTRYAGKKVGYKNHNNKGYILISFNDVKIYAHRVAWLITYGHWPNQEIDHINGDTSDNRLVNLRAVSHSENMKNQKKNIKNSSGQMGVTWCYRLEKWVSTIQSRGSVYSLGYYDNYDDAVAARKSAEQIMGFHENHGRTKFNTGEY